jgi:hypothetical protein
MNSPDVSKTYLRTMSDLEIEELEPQVFMSKTEPLSVHRAKEWRLSVACT